MLTNKQLAELLNIPIDLVGKIEPEQRAAYERMAEVEVEIGLWQVGLGAMPAGVIVCGATQVKVR